MTHILLALGLFAAGAYAAFQLIFLLIHLIGRGER